MRVDTAGRITVFTGVTSQGQGLETTLAQVAADELGVTPDDVTVVAGDTGGIEQGIGTFASRAAVVGGSAVALAARDVRAKAQTLAAQVLGVPEDEIEQDGLGVRAPAPSGASRRPGAELARVAAVATAALGVEPGLECTRYFQPPDITYSSGAHVVLVEVDPDSGQVQVLEYWISHDSGRLINPHGGRRADRGRGARSASAARSSRRCATTRRASRSRGSFMDYAAAAAHRRAAARDRASRDALAPEPAGAQGRGRVRHAAGDGRARVRDRGRAARQTACVIRQMPLTPSRLRALLAR